MNNVLYHLHPVKVKRHALKVSYTLCLGGLSFFLFILLTVTGIFLMFFYRPMADIGGAVAYADMQSIRTTVFFGDLVRNMHRWGAHLMVLLGVPAHGARLLHGRLQAAARVQLGRRRDPALAHAAAVVHRLPAAVGPAGALGRHGGHIDVGYTPFFAKQVNFVLLGGVEIGPRRCCAGTCCTC